MIDGRKLGRILFFRAMETMVIQLMPIAMVKKLCKVIDCTLCITEFHAMATVSQTIITTNTRIRCKMENELSQEKGQGHLFNALMNF